jgi:hypothetical protein
MVVKSSAHRSDRDEWLKKYLMNKIDNALNDESGDTSEIRQYNFNRYYGKQYGDERDGHSKYTTREVFEAVEWALPSVLRVFTANERAVEFIASSSDDEEQAAQETDIANYYIHIENSGFLTLHNWVKDMLMSPNAYAKVAATEEEVVSFDKLSGLTIMDVNKLVDNPNVTILEQEPYLQYVEGYGQQELYRLRVKTKKIKQSIDIDPLPADEVLIDSEWHSVDIEGCPFVMHRTRKSISDLVKRGYDKEELELLGDVDDNTWNDERTNRLFYEEESPENDNEFDRDGASRMLWVHEGTVQVDYDEDGIAESRRIVMIGDEIFENEEDNYQSIVSCASVVMPHKHIAMSLAEAVSDLQLYATTITRQMFDNIYSQTDKRHFFNENGLLEDNSTLDDYLDARSTAILVRGNPHEIVMAEQTAPITGELLTVIEHVKSQPKLRTGVAPELSLDPATLQQSTMGAFMGALDQASQRLDMLVRVIAEVGYKRLMQKVHTLIRRYINEPAQVKLANGWVNFDPSTWQERTKMKVNVGLGHNNNQQKIQLLMGLLGLQKEALGQNLSDPQKIYNTLRRLIEAANLGDASIYFVDPTKPVPNPQTGELMPWQPPQPPPDPNMIMAQAQAQALMQEQQRKAQEGQAKSQYDMQKLVTDAQLAQLKLQMENDRISLSREEFEAKYELDSAETIANIRDTNASALLKHSQREKTQAEVGNIEADAALKELEADDEIRLANEVLDSEFERQAQSANPSEESDTREREQNA